MPNTEMIAVQLRSALWECCAPHFARSWAESSAFVDTVRSTLDDAAAFAAKDPAAAGSIKRVLHSYTSFRAVLHYRLAHAIFEAAESSSRLSGYAELVSSRGKLLSGAELHTRCKIGKRFVLDHGVGTVIGETAVIGDDCYLLGGVTLGARGISGNRIGKRHPLLGDRVQVGAFTRILGDIEIGDDVFIGPHCVITECVPAGSSVTLRTSVQVTRHGARIRNTERRGTEYEHEA